jgi:hypothetical protein
MMKIITLLAMLLAGHSPAAVTYYTFAGTIASIDQDAGDFLKRLKLKEGDSLKYHFAVDTSQPGYVESGPGSRIAFRDTVNTEDSSSIDYFFDSLVAPTVFAPMAEGRSHSIYCGSIASSEVGPDRIHFEHIHSGGDTVVTVSLNVSDPSGYMPDLGALVSGMESFLVASSGDHSFFTTELQLVAISDKKPETAILPGTPAARSAWVQAFPDGDRLILRNRSGRKAQARILDGSGKTWISESMGAYRELFLGALPGGVYLVRVTGPGAPLLLRLTR